MGIVDKAKDKVKKWLLGKALGKAIKRGVQLAVSWVMARKLDQYGVHVNEQELTVALYMGVEVVRNFLKVKYPKYFGWL